MEILAVFVVLAVLGALVGKKPSALHDPDGYKAYGCISGGIGIALLSKGCGK
jgi:hypothetical protein